MVGKEVLGILNMKFMMNGVFILGILDGVNVEIFDVVGDDNVYIFGVIEEQLFFFKWDYDLCWYYENVLGFKWVIDMLIDGIFDDNGFGWFYDLC